MATRCWNCGEEVSRWAALCHNCGATSPAKGKPKIQSQMPIHGHVKTLRPLWIGVLVVILLMFAARAFAAG